MDYIFCVKLKSGGYNRFAGFAAADFAAAAYKLCSCGTVDCAVYTSPPIRLVLVALTIASTFIFTILPLTTEKFDIAVLSFL